MLKSLTWFLCLVLLLLSCEPRAFASSQTDAFYSDGIVPPLKTTTQRDALTGVTAGQLIYNTTTKKLNQHNGSAWVEVGSGVGGINDISPYHDAEGGTTNWATFADAASATGPADGTGGSPTVTWTTSASSPLRDSNSFVLTKDAANRQGEGVAYTFTVPTSDFAKVHTIGFTYNTSSNYANQDVQVWIYDVTNSTLIQPSNYKLDGAPSTGPPGKYQATFQTSATGTSYRLILYVAGTTATAWTLKADDFTVGPQSLVYASPVTDWQSFTPTCSLTGGSTTASGWWKRVGDTLHVKIDAVFPTIFTGGTPTFVLPTGMTMDTSKMPGTPVSGTTPSLGRATFNHVGSDVYTGTVMYSTTTSVVARVMVDDAGAGSAYVATADSISTTTPFTWANNDRMELEFSVPILGWGSSLSTSDTADGRIVAAKYTSSASTAFGNGVYSSAFPWATKVIDTHNAMSSGVYTVPIAGVYRVTNQFVTAAYTGTLGRVVKMGVYKNGSLDSVVAITFKASGSSASERASGSVSVNCSAGDTLDLRGNSDDSPVTLDGTATTNFFEIERISGPSAIAAAESVNATYNSTAGTNLSSATITNIPFPTKEHDTHGAYNTSTGIFTVPIGGKYRISSSIYFASAAWAAGNNVDCYIYKNGSFNAGSEIYLPLTASYYPGTCSVTKTLSVVAGDTLELRAFQNSAGARALYSGTSNWNFLSIERVGN